MKKYLFILAICISNLCFGQSDLKLLDVYYLQDHNLSAGDLNKLHFYVKMFQSWDPYKALPDAFDCPISGNVTLKNNALVKFVFSDFRPATASSISIDLGDNKPVKFWYFTHHTKPYDTQFTYQSDSESGILIKLYIKE